MQVLKSLGGLSLRAAVSVLLALAASCATAAYARAPASAATPPTTHASRMCDGARSIAANPVEISTPAPIIFAITSPTPDHSPSFFAITTPAQHM